MVFNTFAYIFNQQDSYFGIEVFFLHNFIFVFKAFYGLERVVVNMLLFCYVYGRRGGIGAVFLKENVQYRQSTIGTEN